MPELLCNRHKNSLINFKSFFVSFDYILYSVTLSKYWDS